MFWACRAPNKQLNTNRNHSRCNCHLWHSEAVSYSTCHARDLKQTETEPQTMSNLTKTLMIGTAVVGLGLFGSTAVAGCSCSSCKPRVRVPHVQVIVKHCKTCQCSANGSASRNCSDNKCFRGCSGGTACSGTKDCKCGCGGVAPPPTDQIPVDASETGNSETGNSGTGNATDEVNVEEDVVEEAVEEAIEGASELAEPPIEATPSESASESVNDNTTKAIPTSSTKAPIAAPKNPTPGRAGYAEPTKDAVPNPPEPKTDDTSHMNIFDIPIVFDGYGRHVRPGGQRSVRQVGNWR